MESHLQPPCPRWMQRGPILWRSTQQHWVYADIGQIITSCPGGSLSYHSSLHFQIFHFFQTPFWNVSLPGLIKSRHDCPPELMLRPKCWRHHTPWSQEMERSVWHKQEAFCLLEGFVILGGAVEAAGPEQSSYVLPTLNSANYSNDWHSEIWPFMK